MGADGEGRRSGLSWMAIPCDVGGNPVEYLFQVGGERGDGDSGGAGWFWGAWMVGLECRCGCMQMILN